MADELDEGGKPDKHQRIYDEFEELGSDICEALYWAWHRHPRRGNILAAEIRRLRSLVAAPPDAGKEGEKP